MVEVIETGVDKLVELIKARGRISLNEAARELGVGINVVGEWAEFLEEEGIIRIEYKLTDRYLVEREITKKEMDKKVAEFQDQKEIFVRKAENALGTVAKEAKGLKKIKEEFEKVTKDLGFDISHIKEELNELDRYKEVKKDIDQKMVQQQTEFLKRIRSIDRQILAEEKRYTELLGNISKEEQHIERERLEALTIEEHEERIKQRLKNFDEIVQRLKKEVVTEDEKILASEEHIQRLKALASSIKARIQMEKQEILALGKKSIEQEKNIIQLQNAIIEKIRKKEKDLSKVSRISEKCRRFFNEKMKTEMLLDKVHHDKAELELALWDLVKKAKILSIAKGAGMGRNLLELETKFKEVDRKKQKFEKELKQLGRLLKE